ncbi:MAG: DUF4959 domain-containing protein [Prevotellaceae bacterium]|jgi:hypothetical protein|nr:DUF4959 domain-containing protein [Prevotellaceae bacterium]
MFKNIFFTLIAFVCAAALASCGKDNVNDPHGSTAVPRQVTVSRVADREGSSVIYFKLPDDKNIKFVRAEWTTDDGKHMDATASFYTDSLVAEGFRDACTVEVRLYSVSTGNVASEPVRQTVSPRTPPYLAIAERVAVNPYFRGIRIDADNETKSRLSFFIYKRNDTVQGGWQELGQLHTSAPKVEYAIKGQDTLEATFAVRVKDGFGHWSEYKQHVLTPWWEELCDKGMYSECRVHRLDDISGEYVFDDKCADWDGHQMHSWGGSDVAFSRLWDDLKMKSAASCYHTKPQGSKIPQSFCIDLGKEYSLSRAMVWMRASDTRMGGSSDDWQHVWKGGMPKLARIYGSTYIGSDPAHNLADNLSDPSWLFIGEGFFTRADGSSDPLPSGVGTDDDRLKLENGFEIVFSIPAGQKIRYVRFQTVELYSFATAVMLSELEFHGSDK